MLYTAYGGIGSPSAPFFLSGAPLHDTDDAFDDIIYTREIPFTMSMIENLNRFSCQEFICEPKVRHIRTATRAVKKRSPVQGMLYSFA